MWKPSIQPIMVCLHTQYFDSCAYTKGKHNEYGPFSKTCLLSGKLLQNFLQTFAIDTDECNNYI